MQQVFSFKQALENGYNPSEYKFNKDIPTGILSVRLDFKIWAKQGTPAVTCFCTDTISMQQIRFNVFRNKDGEYLLPNTNIDSEYMPYDTLFSIDVTLNKKGNIAVKGVKE